MKYASAIALTLCLLSADHAFAQRRITDFSMSEEESLRQPTTKGSSSGNYQQFMNQQQGGGGIGNNFNYNRGSSNYNTQLPGQSTGQFMAGFCDPNFKPMLSNTGNIASLNACIEGQKQQACDMFTQLPRDVQQAMDEVIGCIYNSANGGEMDENGYIRQMPTQQDCSQGDTIRMNLLKQHWNDQNVAYAIIFLPDLVIDGPNRCMGGN